MTPDRVGGHRNARSTVRATIALDAVMRRCYFDRFMKPRESSILKTYLITLVNCLSAETQRQTDWAVFGLETTLKCTRKVMKSDTLGIGKHGSGRNGGILRERERDRSNDCVVVTESSIFFCPLQSCVI